MDPKIVIGAFKGELCRCYRLCSSPEQTKNEIEFTLNLYEDNGHDREMLKKIADDYKPNISNAQTKDKNNASKKNK